MSIGKALGWAGVVVVGLLFLVAMVSPGATQRGPSQSSEPSLPADSAKLLIGRFCSGTDVVIEYSWLNWYMELGVNRIHLEEVAMASKRSVSKKEYDELTGRLYYLRDLMPVGTERMLVNRGTTLSPRFTYGNKDRLFGDYLC